MVCKHDIACIWWAICCQLKDGEIVDVYPARVKFRGFSEDSNTQGYKNITNYLKEILP